jgi:hypothetical protein
MRTSADESVEIKLGQKSVRHPEVVAASLLVDTLKLMKKFEV